MIRRKKTIVIDLDSTIINTSKTIINLYNKINPDNKIEYIEDHNWNFEPMIRTKEELSELFKLFDNPMFYGDTLVIYDKAKEVINKLCEHYNIIIMTKHNESRKPITSKFIKQMFPKVELKFVDNFSDKGKIVQDCFLVIDDRVDSLTSFDCDVIKVCYGDYQWNKEWKGFRMINWLEIENFLENIYLLLFTNKIK